MTTKPTFKKSILLSGFCAVLFAAVLFVLFFSDTFRGQSEGTPLQIYADKIFTKCSQTGYAPSCYDKEIPKLMDVISMEQAFKVARFIQEKDSRYIECHVLGHHLSEREVAKDPAAWKDVVTRCPVSMCNNGCHHGALMARFGNETEVLSFTQIEEIKSDLADVCEPRGIWNPTEVERSMCYHAIGHLNMYVTGANINRSVKICEDIGTKKDGRNYIQTCTEGVLMSVYQPLGPEDVALVKDIRPKKEEVNSFCAKYTGMAFFACHKESWPLFMEEIVEPRGLVEFCSYTDESFPQTNCYASVMNILTILFVVNEENLDKLKNFCTGLPKERVGLCFAQAARRLMQIDPVYYADRAGAVCRAAETARVGKECYEELADYASLSFHAGSKEFTQYCNTLPFPWDKKCLHETTF